MTFVGNLQLVAECWGDVYAKNPEKVGERVSEKFRGGAVLNGKENSLPDKARFMEQLIKSTEQSGEFRLLKWKFTAKDKERFWVEWEHLRLVKGKGWYRTKGSHFCKVESGKLLKVKAKEKEKLLYDGEWKPDSQPRAMENLNAAVRFYSACLGKNLEKTRQALTEDFEVRYFVRQRLKGNETKELFLENLIKDFALKSKVELLKWSFKPTGGKSARVNASFWVSDEEENWFPEKRYKIEVEKGCIKKIDEHLN